MRKIACFLLAFLSVMLVSSLVSQHWANRRDDTLRAVGRPGYSPHAEAFYRQKMAELAREDPAATRPATQPGAGD